MEKPLSVLDECDHGADRKRSPQHLDSAGPENQGEKDAAEQLDGGKKDGIIADGLEMRLEMIPVETVELLPVGLLAVEQLNGHHAAYILLKHGIDTGETDPDSAKRAAHPPPEDKRGRGDEG